MAAIRKLTDASRIIKYSTRELVALFSRSRESLQATTRAPAPQAGRPHVHILDTSIASDNVGDEIIMKSAYGYIEDAFKDYYITTSSSHDGIGPSSRKLIHRADIVLLVGTNALSAKYHANRPFIWQMRSSDIDLLRGKVVLFGVGANKAFQRIEKNQADFLDEVLSKQHLHAARDLSGKRILESVGRRAVDTTCPTLWMFRDKLPAHPADKSERVCFTLTQHKASSEDREMIRILRENYNVLYFWPQQPRDLTYLQSLTETDDIKVIASNLRSYDNVLINTDLDVVGTRLHGTIRALQHNKRVIVIGIDNRSQDIAAKTGLSYIERKEIRTKLAGQLQSRLMPRLDIPSTEIDAFLKQFKVRNS